MAENGSIRADAESQRNYRDSRKAWRFAQHAQAVFQIEQQVFDKRNGFLIAIGFFDRLDSPEFQVCLAASLGGRHASTNFFLRLKSDVLLNFCAETILLTATADQIGYAC
jgi:hypothetical protein